MQHPAADVGDEVRALGDGHEVGGGDEAAAAVLQADDGLGAADEARLQRDQGLVVQLEAAGDERLAQVLGRAAALGDFTAGGALAQLARGVRGGGLRVHLRVRLPVREELSGGV